MQSHYEILGVSPSATNDEIKAAYRKLCMQTHPDVAGARTQNADKFKRISEAYSILGNIKERKRYDFETSEVGIGELRKRAAAAARAGGGGGAGSSFGATLPRNLLIGSVIGFTGVTLMRMMWPTTEEEADDTTRVAKTGHKKLVEAWKNPNTGRWEKPVPWDPVYQKLQPALQLVPREDVHDGKRR
mmetsp:Transcript_15904/g.33597  ORF Transcript_15904/g.33597 Transcript_15904/m.33597 type:complete len:187 (+) Transcript_15904:137-697(+)